MMRRIFWVLVLLISPAAVFAAPLTYAGLVNELIGIMNGLIGLLVLAALVTYLFLLAFSIAGVGENSKERSKALFLWGVIILFVMVSIWGIVFLIHNTIFPSQIITHSHPERSVV